MTGKYAGAMEIALLEGNGENGDGNGKRDTRTFNDGGLRGRDVIGKCTGEKRRRIAWVGKREELRGRLAIEDHLGVM